MNYFYLLFIFILLYLKKIVLNLKFHYCLDLGFFYLCMQGRKSLNKELTLFIDNIHRINEENWIINFKRKKSNNNCKQ
ncbi:hypothetical protein ACMBCN_02245 [Candidatus Liberibacter asiaticus]|nr:hypothetical protein [Candidatus Liberibacter asiaticus]